MTSQPNPTEKPQRLTVAIVLAAVVALLGADTPTAVPSDPIFSALKTDGTTVSGRLRQLVDKGGVVLAVDDKERLETIPGSALVKLTREGSTPPPASDGGVVLFPDGDRLLHAVIGPAGETSIEVQPLNLGSIAIPLDSILGLILVPPTDPDALNVMINRVREEPRTGEILLLSNGDRLTGGLLSIDDKKIGFQSPGGKAELDRSGVIALGFDPKNVAYPRPRDLYLELTFIDGSRIGVVSAHVEGGQIQATTRYGQPIKLPVGELSRIHSKNGPVAYLSDRAPSIDKYVSYLGPTRPVRLNQAVDGQPLRLGGKTYDLGLGTQSRSYLVYQLEAGWNRFQALTGVDDRAGPLGSVVFRVVVNGKEVYTSSPASVRETPKPLDIDIKGAKTLILITDFGERGPVRDHGDWVEARLVR